MIYMNTNLANIFAQFAYKIIIFGQYLSFGGKFSQFSVTQGAFYGPTYVKYPTLDQEG